MIELASRVLCEAGLIEEGQPVESVITVGRSLNVQVFPQGTGGFYNVKLSRLDLEREYKALLELKGTLPIPIPLGFSRICGMDALITQGISFKCVRGTPPSLGEFVQRYHYLQLELEAFAAPAKVHHRDVIREMLECPAFEDLKDYTTGWLASNASDFLERLPAVRQHGDLVPQNLGIGGGGYVILDWEDFGVATLPGLDLGIFLLDVATSGFATHEVRRSLSPIDPQIAALRDCMIRTLRLQQREFPHMLFAILITYLYLKGAMQYRTPIVDATRRLVLELLGCQEMIVQT